MRLLAHVSVGMLAAALVIAAGAASAASLTTDPPTLLTPPSGKVFKARTPIAFTIRTHPGDDSLWLSVSRSPTVVNACGTIAHEVSIWDFQATTDPSVYEARPTYYSFGTFWMNTPGTYYWQAHRIEYAGGADGCIESAVRSLSIAAPTDTPIPKVIPKPTTKQPLALSKARLAGSFDVTTKITAASGINVKKGTTDTGVWKFTPACSAGPCRVRLRYDYRGASFDSHTVRVGLARSGAVYHGTTRTPLVECNFKDVHGTMTVRLQVKGGAWIDGRWHATRVTGRYDYSAAATTSGIYRCPAARITATVRGSLER